MEQTSQIKHHETEVVHIFMCLCASLIAFLIMHEAGVTSIFYRMTPAKVYCDQIICVMLCTIILAVRQSIRICGAVYFALIPPVMFVIAALGFEASEFLFDTTKMLNGLKHLPLKNFLVVSFLVMPTASAAWLSGTLAVGVPSILQRIILFRRSLGP